MKTCYKDKERKCDENCVAYIEQVEGGKTNCLDLNIQAEVVKKMDNVMHSNDLNSFYMRLLVSAITGFGEKLDSLKQ